MPIYNVYRLRENARQQFRWAPHTIGITIAKRKDYDLINAVESSGVYAVWMALKDSDQALQIGDILEVEGGELRIYKFVGFEEAQWHVPELKPAADLPATSATVG